MTFGSDPMDWLWLVFGCVAAAAVVVKVRMDRAAAAEERRKTFEGERQRQAAMEAARRAYALTCRRCNSLAPPIPGTGNRYRCDRCSNQFAAAPHRL